MVHQYENSLSTNMIISNIKKTACCLVCIAMWCILQGCGNREYVEFGNHHIEISCFLTNPKTSYNYTIKEDGSYNIHVSQPLEEGGGSYVGPRFKGKHSSGRLAQIEKELVNQPLRMEEYVVDCDRYIVRSKIDDGEQRLGMSFSDCERVMSTSTVIDELIKEAFQKGEPFNSSDEKKLEDAQWRIPR